MAKAREENKHPKSRSELMKEPRKGTSKIRGSDRLGPNSSVVKKSTARPLSSPSQSTLNMDRDYSRAYTGELFMAQEKTKDARRVKSEGSGLNSSLIKESRSGCLPWSQSALHIGKTYNTKDTERWGKDLYSTNHYTWRVKNNPGIKRHNYSSGVNVSKGPMAKAGDQGEKPKNHSKEWGGYSSNVNLCRSGGGHSASRSRDTKTLTERQYRTYGQDRSISLEVKVIKTGWPLDRFNRSFWMGSTGTSNTGDDKENECRSNTYNQTNCNAQKSVHEAFTLSWLRQAAPDLKKSGTWNESDVGDVSYLDIDRSGSLSLPDWSQATHCNKKNSDAKVEDWRGEAHDQTNLDVWSPIRSNILVPTNGGSNSRCIYYYSPLVEGTRAGREPDSTRGGDTDESSDPVGTTLFSLGP